jgi:hypothetical protein
MRGYENMVIDASVAETIAAEEIFIHDNRDSVNMSLEKEIGLLKEA